MPTFQGQLRDIRFDNKNHTTLETLSRYQVLITKPYE